jgi:diguanylate cyclase (GGDEF)-like protein/PAS domain S-box-containing protein
MIMSANGSDKTERFDTRTFFEKLFTSLPDAIVVVDSGGRILEANPQTELLFGYPCSELLGNRIEMLIPERFRSAHETHRDDYRDQPRLRPMGAGHELYGRRKDGSEFPVDIMLSPLEADGGRLVLGVIRDITEQKKLEGELRHLVSSDPLTHLGNYRRLEEAFDREVKWFQRNGRSCALLLLDLDGLKAINDTYGHLAGDRALCRLGDTLRAECRVIDTAVRHGGDEFAVILPDTNADGARNLARRVERRLALDVDHAVHFSYGVGAFPDDGQTLQQLLSVVDRPLYEMKKSKRIESKRQRALA